MIKIISSVYDWLRRGLRWRDSPQRMISSAQSYWTGPAVSKPHMAHIRGPGGLRSEVWEALGNRHARILQMFARSVEMNLKDLTIVDWGCGGGANVVALAPFASRILGVDVAQHAIDAAQREAAPHIQAGRFETFLIDSNDPETIHSMIPSGAVDVFFCTYVFELIPTPAYGERILMIARRLLHNRGIAVVQIKYEGSRRSTRSRHHTYRLNVANTTTYDLAQFWSMSSSAGFTPLLFHLIPTDELVSDERYAYVLLTPNGVATR